MAEEYERILKKELIPAFFGKGAKADKIKPIKAGHINTTVKFTLKNDPVEGRSFITQRINTGIFKEPEKLMENAVKVTDHLREKAALRGDDPERATLHFTIAKDGNPFVRDSEGGFWRCYRFVDDCFAYDSVTDPSIFRNGGVALGIFQKDLADFPAGELTETIPNFHNTVSRYADFKKAVREDRAGRAASVQKEIEFALEREKYAGVILDAMASGEVPVRVTHNDTKFNNVLIDSQTGKVLCMIDLDTVMPGSALFDFGDSIRYGASSAAEDETDLDTVHFVPELYDAYLDGYMSEVGDVLTAKEKELLPLSAIILTLECGIRFLGDYLNGDIYFGISRESHNLDRARTQFKLIEEQEKYFGIK